MTMQTEFRRRLIVRAVYGAHAFRVGLCISVDRVSICTYVLTRPPPIDFHLVRGTDLADTVKIDSIVIDCEPSKFSS